MSDLPGFPKPIRLGRFLYWRRSDLDALESAMLAFQGRVAFEARRRAKAKIKALRQRVKSARAPKQRAATGQGDLFDR